MEFLRRMLRILVIARLMDLLLSADKALVSGRTQQTVLLLLEQHAAALKDMGQTALAYRVNEFVLAMRSLGRGALA